MGPDFRGAAINAKRFVCRIIATKRGVHGVEWKTEVRFARIRFRGAPDQPNFSIVIFSKRVVIFDERVFLLKYNNI